MANNEEYDDTNKGAIWKSKFTDNPKSPQYTGHLNVEGEDYKVSAWKSTSDNPKAPVLNIQIQKVSEFEAAQPKKVESPSDDEDVPF